MGNESSSTEKDKGLKLNKVQIVLGEVKSHSTEANITTVELGDGTLVQCLWAVGIFSPLLGIRFNYVPTIGTRVHVLFTGADVSFIISTHPDDDVTTPTVARNINNGGEEVHQNYLKTQVGEARNSDKDEMFFNSNTTPLNLVEGELEISNPSGIAVTLLRNLAKLSAGDLAKVECFLLDDMVRIVSDTFKHVTAFGNYHIYNDNGQLNVRWDGTHRDHEAWGLKDDSEGGLEPEDLEKFEKDDNGEIDLSSIDSYIDSGRWRFSNFIGQLGNFFTAFITDPSDSIGKIAEENMRAGRFKMHVNNDGSFYVGSVGDIIFERVVRSVVPVEKKRVEDPSIEHEALNEDPLASWIPDDEDTIFHTAYKLRDYARWFSNYYSLAEFHLNNGQWKVPSESESPTPHKDNRDIKKKQSNGGITDEIYEAYVDKYSTFRMFKDGTMLFMDADGSSIHLSNGNAFVSAAKSIYYEAADSIHMVAGKDITMKAYRSIDMDAITGGIGIRANDRLQQYCNTGSILLHSRAVKSDEEDSVDNGIILKSERSDILLDTNNLFKQRAMQGIRTCALSVSNWLFSGDFIINDGLKFNGHSGFIDSKTGLRGNIVAADNIMGRPIFFPSPFGGEHGNHIIEKPDDGTMDPQLDEDSDELEEAKELRSRNDFKFEHRDNSEYDTEDELFETLTQQKLRLEPEDNYTVWNSSLDVSGLPSPHKAPWPGRNAQHLIYNPEEIESLNRPSNRTQFKNRGPALELTDIQFRRKKLPGE